MSSNSKDNKNKAIVFLLSCLIALAYAAFLNFILYYALFEKIGFFIFSLDIILMITSIWLFTKEPNAKTIIIKIENVLKIIFSIIIFSIFAYISYMVFNHENYKPSTYYKYIFLYLIFSKFLIYIFSVGIGIRQWSIQKKEQKRSEELKTELAQILERKTELTDNVEKHLFEKDILSKLLESEKDDTGHSTLASLHQHSAKLSEIRSQKLVFERQPYDPFPVCLPPKELFSSTLIMGGVGSGKTSASGQAISDYLLRLGAGGLILTYKTGEAEDWEQRVEAAGVDPDNVYVFNHESGLKLDFLCYEMTRKTANAGDITNLVDILKTVGRLAKGLDATQDSRGGDNEFWEQAALKLIKNVITLQHIAFDQVRLEFTATLIDQLEWGKELDTDRKLAKKSYLVKVKQCIKEFHDDKETLPKINSAGRILTPSESRDYQSAWIELTETFPNRPERTRGSITNQAALMYAPLMTGKMRDMFASGSITIWPEIIFEGKIVILDISLQTYGESGKVAQGVWKYLFQKAVERRPEKHDNHPIFLWVDEAHQFLNELDQRFLTVSRSKNCATVFLSQNIANFNSAIGIEPTKAMLGVFGNYVFHQNNSHETNEYAANMIGKYWHQRKNFSQSTSDSTSTNESESSSRTSGLSESKTVGSSSSYGRSYNSENTFILPLMAHTISDSSSYGSSSSTTFGTSHSDTAGTSTGSSETHTEGSSSGYTEVREFLLQPDDFRLLSRTWGAIEAIIYSNGTIFYDGLPYFRAIFYDPAIEFEKIESKIITTESNTKTLKLGEDKINENIKKDETEIAEIDMKIQEIYAEAEALSD